MIAALPMYDFPELREVTDAFWEGLRGHLAAAGLTGIPSALTRPADVYAHWLDPQLLLSQTCGFPLTHELKGKVRYLATPGYEAPGCDGSTYRSFVIVRAVDDIQRGGDLSSRVVAFNGADSQSGCNVLKHYLAGQGIVNGLLRGAIESGAHRKSVALVKAGLADFCAVDCVSWTLLTALAPNEVVGLRILDQTAPAPCLPFITSRALPVEDVASLRTGLSAAFNDDDLAPVREKLLLASLTVLDEATYDVIAEQEMSAKRAGWARVA
ncbi:PhnD/SsuA/transferrin family substrate-binding protein [Dongia mobilis]|jgi:ABC-type phosphate/phosphonate transport system substrate-binding protein|uniref:phosphate/phosphite/phosphonate ABC transporter substrate-binding protein n=1 Tax=Dongia sp. TaxID=1977262 RepID=UPI0026F2381B